MIPCEKNDGLHVTIPILTGERCRIIGVFLKENPRTDVLATAWLVPGPVSLKEGTRWTSLSKTHLTESSVDVPRIHKIQPRSEREESALPTDASI